MIFFFNTFSILKEAFKCLAINFEYILSSTKTAAPLRRQTILFNTRTCSQLDRKYELVSVFETEKFTKILYSIVPMVIMSLLEISQNVWLFREMINMVQ